MRSIFFALLLLTATAALADEGAAGIDSIWKRRDDPSVAKELEAKTAALLAAKPDDAQALLQRARWKHWQADVTSNMDKKKALGKEAWQLAEKCLQKDPSAYACHYYAALGVGAYSQAAGILTALGEGLESKFVNNLDAAINANAKFESGGGIVARGRYWYELPWPKRNLDKSNKFLEQAIAQNPENLRAYVYLAETQLKDGKAKVAQATLQKAINGSVDYDPPEGRFSKELAKPVAAEIAKSVK